LLVDDGSKAVRCYEERGDEIDLVILDMTMPVMDGRECFRRLREIDPSVKVIVSTGHALNGAAQEVIDNGAVRFLQKPFVIAQLSDAVAKALSGDSTEATQRGRSETDGETSPRDIDGLRNESLEALTEMLQRLMRLKTACSEDKEVGASIEAMLGRLRKVIDRGVAGAAEDQLWHEFGNLVGGVRYFVAGLLEAKDMGDAVPGAARAVEDSASRTMELMARWRETAGRRDS
jgi:CheY-like chemotaxis protein